MKTTGSLLFALFFLLFTANQANAQDDATQGIVFQKMNLQEALEKSKETNKLVFIDCYATWCGPCKELSKEIFTRNDVGSFFNSHFICLSQDMEGKGKETGTKYEVKAYPTLLFLDNEGNVVQKSVGFLQAPALIDLGTKAMDPKMNSRALAQRYQQGKTDYAVIENQLRNANENTSVTGLFDKYFKSIDPEKWFEKDAWNLIRNYAPAGSTYFNFLLVNEEKFSSLYGRFVVKRVIEDKFYSLYVQKTEKEGMDQAKAADYMKTFHHPMAIKAVIRYYKDNVVYKLERTPKDRECWKNLLQVIDKLIVNFGENEKENFRTTAVCLCNTNNYSKKVIAAIESTNDKWAAMMVQNMKLCHVQLLLKDTLLNQDKIDEINTTVNELADSVMVQIVYADLLAKNLLEHPQRKEFLKGARKISSGLIKYNAPNYLLTYVKICAQMKDFDEAVKYSEMILQLAQKSYPDKIEPTEDLLNKFRQHQTPF